MVRPDNTPGLGGEESPKPTGIGPSWMQNLPAEVSPRDVEVLGLKAAAAGNMRHRLQLGGIRVPRSRNSGQKLTLRELGRRIGGIFRMSRAPQDQGKTGG